jgi:hypothetical protein
MADGALTELLRKAPISFVGTVENLGAATMSDVPIDERTAVVFVDHVLHAPEPFVGLEGHRVTLQLADDGEPIAEGQSATFFAEGLAYGETVALKEVGRLPVDAVEPHVMRAVEGGEPAFAALEREVEADRFREHADAADAVIVGRVMGLQNVGDPPRSEHDPDWWKATIDVVHVERGDVAPGSVEVLYPNSLDVRWRKSPKPKASQEGVWVLHATEGALREFAPFRILDPQDYHPVERLEALRENGS